MASITWGPQLETGIGVIDRQHQHWVDLFNELSAAVEQGRGEAEVGKTLDALLDYSVSHFRTEEGLMARHGYDDLERHRAEHKIFTDQIRIFKERVELAQWSLSLEVLEYLRDWLVEHVTATDRGYIPTLSAAGLP